MRRLFRPLLPLVLAALVLAGCASAPDDPDGRIAVVASTDVYGDIAAQIGGAHVAVTSLISNAAQDPHSFEASAQDQLAISHADVIIENGEGYDPFVDELLAASGNTDAVLLIATEVSGIPVAPPTNGDVVTQNEHIWYNFTAADRVAAELAQRFGDLDPANADVYRQNYRSFSTQLDVVAGELAELRVQWTGTEVASTEPVPRYLLDAAGLIDRTPRLFSDAVEEGADVPPLVLQQALALVTDHRIALLAVNEQTEGPETGQLRAAAEHEGIPTVSFTETLPDGSDYLSWMEANVAAVRAALESSS